MVSVTPDTAANSSGPPAPSRLVKAERSAAPDSFASLIGDSAAEAASNDRASAARDQPAPPRRADETAAENRQPRDSSCSRARDHVGPADDDSKAARTDRGDACTEVGDASKPAKSGVAKIVGATPDTKVKDTSDTGSATDQTVSPTIGSAVAASTVVAVAIPVAVASATISAASSPQGGAQTPLAIAASAIASSSAINGSQSAPAPSADAATAQSGLGTATDKAAGSGIDALGNEGSADGMSVTQTVASGDMPSAIEQQAAAAIATGAAKTDINTTSATRPSPGAEANSADFRPDDSGTSLQSTDKTASAQHQVTDGKSDADGAVLAAKPEASTANTPVFARSPHEHIAAGATGPAQADLSASGIQAASYLQQPQSTVIAPNQLNVTVASSAAIPLNALALQIAATVQSGQSRFEIRLDPAELGRIDVRIDIDRQGQMTSHLTVEKPETLTMLRQDAPQLQRALDDAGFKTGNGGLQFSLRDQSSSSGQNSGNESTRHGQRLLIGNDETISATAAGRTYGRALASSGGVDIRV